MHTASRICLIDDDIFVLDALALALRDAGYAVTTAPGAAAGFDIVMREGAEVVITDLNMPGTNGMQMIAQARAMWPDLPIIAISGASMIAGQPVSDAAHALGANALLPKPFRASELVALLEDVLAARRSSD